MKAFRAGLLALVCILLAWNEGLFRKRIVNEKSAENATSEAPLKKREREVSDEEYENWISRIKKGDVRSQVDAILGEPLVVRRFGDAEAMADYHMYNDLFAIRGHGYAAIGASIFYQNDRVARIDPILQGRSAGPAPR